MRKIKTQKDYFNHEEEPFIYFTVGGFCEHCGDLDSETPSGTDEDGGVGYCLGCWYSTGALSELQYDELELWGEVVNAQT